jgi:hypothetical protein
MGPRRLGRDYFFLEPYGLFGAVAVFLVATTLKVDLVDEQPLPPPDELPDDADELPEGLGDGVTCVTTGFTTVVTTTLPDRIEQPLLPPDELPECEPPDEPDPLLGPQPLPPPEEEMEPPPWPSSSTEPEGSTAPFGPP